ncbi:hypothetical protein ILYODFUR_019540 [Ilyodon furcidens]|uniref:Uncharacterized protein n=1 Tax=Ilyodon furcidens TaxID=33524 RepID=A0ABV0UHP3_9TELE
MLSLEELQRSTAQVGSSVSTTVRCALYKSDFMVKKIKEENYCSQESKSCLDHKPQQTFLQLKVVLQSIDLCLVHMAGFFFDLIFPFRHAAIIMMTSDNLMRYSCCV